MIRRLAIVTAVAAIAGTILYLSTEPTIPETGYYVTTVSRPSLAEQLGINDIEAAAWRDRRR